MWPQEEVEERLEEGFCSVHVFYRTGAMPHTGHMEIHRLVKRQQKT